MISFIQYDIGLGVITVVGGPVGGSVGGLYAGSNGCQDEAWTCGTNHCSIMSGSAPKISWSIDPIVPDFMMVLSDSGSMNRDLSQVKIQKHHFHF